MTTEKITGTYQSFDGTEIYYEVRGHGRPVVLVYGIACLMNHWLPQVRYFSENQQTILFDLRGHHKSEKPTDPNNLTIEALAKDIDGLLKHLQIEKASFWGHSFGAQIILKLYEMAPEYFESLVFINGFAKNPIEFIGGFDVVGPSVRFLKERYSENPAMWTSVWTSLIKNPIAVQLSALLGGFNLKLTSFKDIEIYARGVAAMDVEVFLRLFEELVTWNGEHILDQVKVPTLIIGGDKDLVTPLKHQIKMHSAIKNSEYLSVPYGSHCTHLDYPEFVNLRIEKFLKRG